LKAPRVRVLSIPDESTNHPFHGIFCHMTDRESGEVLQPPQKSAQQLVKDLAERFAVDLYEQTGDYLRYFSSYPLPAGSLGMIALGTPDVSFEQVLDATAMAADYSIFIGCDMGDNILTINLCDGELSGGYGEVGTADKALAAEHVKPLLEKLSAQMWLHERGLDSPELTEANICNVVVETVESLTQPPTDDPDGDRFATHPLVLSGGIWSALETEKQWGNGLRYGLSLMDGDREIASLCVNVDRGKDTSELFVTDHSGRDLTKAQALDRTRILFSILAEAIATGQINETA